MISTRRRQLVESFANKEIRDLFIEEQIATGLAFQIREMREARALTQSDLGGLAGIQQARISELEDPDYGSYTLSTLKRIASALDVGLIVRFAPFSEIIDWTLTLTPERLAPPGFDQEFRYPETTTFGDISNEMGEFTIYSASAFTSSMVEPVSGLVAQGITHATSPQQIARKEKDEMYAQVA